MHDKIDVINEYVLCPNTWKDMQPSLSTNCCTEPQKSTHLNIRVAFLEPPDILLQK